MNLWEKWINKTMINLNTTKEKMEENAEKIVDR